MHYLGNPDYAHDGSDRVGVLLVNHGSPTAPETGAVRRYLRSFLSDPRLVELPRWLWWPLLNGIILLSRPPRTAGKYRRIWSAAGSPMDRISAELLEKLQARCELLYGGRLQLALGMSYGQPSIAAGLDELRNAGCTRVLILPLYPQYTAVTVGSVFDLATRALQRWRWVPELRFVNGYADQPEYIAALAESLRAHWARNGRAQRLLLSFHSLPQDYADAGDPYPCFCEKTARLLAAELGLADDQYTVAYQSRFGRGQWLRPYTEDLLEAWREAGVRSVDIICPGFAVDNLETLEEIQLDYAQRFAAGGGTLRLVSCLNAGDGQLATLEALLRQQLRGWEDALKPARLVPPVGASAGR